MLGPPVSGKKILARALAKRTGSVLLNQKTLLENIPVNFHAELGKLSRDVSKLMNLFSIKF